MHLPHLQKIAILLPFLLIGCSYQSTQNMLDTTKEPDVIVAWKTVAAAPDANGSKVNLILVMSGAVMREIPVGTFHGDELMPPSVLDDKLLYRDWWSGPDNQLFLKRKDATHLFIENTPMDPEAPVPGTMTIDIPAGLQIDCVDTGGCA